VKVAIDRAQTMMMKTTSSLKISIEGNNKADLIARRSMDQSRCVIFIGSIQFSPPRKISFRDSSKILSPSIFRGDSQFHPLIIPSALLSIIATE
jgi:hypothetical protein